MELDVNILKKLAKEYNLGEIVETPYKTTGGFCHTVYKITTTKGEYLIKPVGANTKDGKNFWKGKDALEEKLIQNNIPGIYSLKFNNSRVQVFNDELIYIIPCFNGKPIRGDKATNKQTKQMAKCSALVNNIDLREEGFNLEPISIDWQYYVDYAKDKNEYIYNTIKDNLNLLNELTEKGNAHIHKMTKHYALSHCDMDYKNVLWNKKEFKLIDMDSLSYYNPYMLLFKNALVWSGYEENNINYRRFKLFIKTYFKHSNLKEKTLNLEDYYYATMLGLKWLEVNMQRVLHLVDNWKEMCDIGLEQTKITIAQIQNYYKNKHKIISIKI